MAFVGDDHDPLCLGVGEHLSQQLFKIRLPGYGHICSAEVFLM